MANVFKIEIQGLTQTIQQMNSLPAQLTKKLDYVLEKGARAIEGAAKRNAANNAFDTGNLARSISVVSRPLEKEIAVNANYAAFMEFGTGKYAAAYVSTLPQDWQTYAAQFKGQSGGGSFADMVRDMQEWARRKGLADWKQAGYLIARSIIINGVHAHPFLYPAFYQEMPNIQRDIQDAIDSFAI